MSLKITFKCPHCNRAVMGLMSVWEYSDAEEKDNPILLIPRVCESSGLYDCYIECPICGEDISVMD